MLRLLFWRMRLLEKYKQKLLLLILVSTLIITGCGGGTNNTSVGNVNDVGSDGEDNTDSLSVGSDELEVAELPTPAESEPEDEIFPSLGFALGDPELHATDPSTVLLASGQLQLIEFFAFW